MLRGVGGELVDDDGEAERHLGRDHHVLARERHAPAVDPRLAVDHVVDERVLGFRRIGCAGPLRLAERRKRRHGFPRGAPVASVAGDPSEMTFDFADTRVVVAGGSRGIGRSIALAFAQAGANVSICARGAEALAAADAEIGRHARTHHAAVCNLADSEAIARYVPEAAAALGGIDVLINNASGFGVGDDDAGWDASTSVDIMATVRASRAAV
ncbi:MAG TPA: SDR family NAD(P)-dependent oxidoreductase, partial [Beijerinckiaceae bacterium]|nr:SDR family NAD(P)-dependent oxidoreductase [Beijerinckiaceae bacterium]